MILAEGVKAYAMAIPFTFEGRLFCSGSVIVVADDYRIVYRSHEWANLEKLDPWKAARHTEDRSC